MSRSSGPPRARQKEGRDSRQGVAAPRTNGLTSTNIAGAGSAQAREVAL